MYYLQTRYYDPEIGRFISQDSIDYADPETINGLNLYAYCLNNPVMNIDPTGNSWKKFWAGLGMVLTAVAAVAISIATFGAATPLAMTIVAGVTLAAGVLTGVNGIATMVEAGTDYNFMRDGLFQCNETAYNWYAGITETVAAIGTMVLGIYNATGYAKATRYGRNFLGKGYSKVGKGRWVSADGLRQFRLDTSHPYKSEMLGNHINLDYFKRNYWTNYRVPKYKSYRIIEISDELNELLIKEMARQLRAKDYYGIYFTNYFFDKPLYFDGKEPEFPESINRIGNDDEWYPIHLVCIRENGTFISPRTLQHTTRSIKKDICKNFDFHSLRHTHASMLAEIGVEQKYIQTRLGHSDVKITIDVYEHTTDLMRMRGRKAINDLYM